VHIKLSPPPDLRAKFDKEVAEVEQFFKARKLKLGKTKRQRLDRAIRRMLEAHEAGTSGLRQKLTEYNNFLEGVREAVDFPFGAGQSSDIDTRYCANKARTLRASFIRSVFADQSIFVSEVLPGAKRDVDDNMAEAAMNWTAEKDTNAIEALKDSPIPIFRDGTGLIHGEWEREIENGTDYRAYENAEEFQADYPDAEAAGVDAEEYSEILERLSEPESEVHVEFEADFVAKNGPVYTIFPLAKFLWFPLYARSIRDLDLYGYSYTESGGKFEGLVKHGFYDYDVAEEARKVSPSPASTPADTWDAGRDSIEGISSSDEERVSYRIAKLVVSHDLDDDKVPERYVVYWDTDSHRSLRLERYGLWRNTSNVIAFRFIKRDGRFLGSSLLGDSIDLFKELNALHRHRSNTRRLTDSVTLMLPKILKEDVDLGAEYAEFRPGMTMWLPNDLAPDKWPRQLQVYNLSRSNDSLDEEGLLTRYIDGVIGVSEGQSGRESPQDPSAPASKTAMLLQRADLRIEDLIEEWKRSVADFAALHVALYYQNAKAKIKFMSKQEGKLKESELATAVLGDPRRRFSLKSVKPQLTPEYEMNKLVALISTAFQLQIPVSAKPEIVIEAWNDYVTASRVPLPERFQIEMNGGNMSMGGQQVGMQQVLGQIRQMAAAQVAQNGATAAKPRAGGMLK